MKTRKRKARKGAQPTRYHKTCKAKMLDTPLKNEQRNGGSSSTPCVPRFFPSILGLFLFPKTHAKLIEKA